ncbi:MAG: hypothetical protein CM15mP128_1290 [Methanobacteriota archaeon]|nr:MAG: hypothetical protein CM15mP128_1290 [Euryarchaeota archaeon]
MPTKRSRCMKRAPSVLADVPQFPDWGPKGHPQRAEGPRRKGWLVRVVGGPHRVFRWRWPAPVRGGGPLLNVGAERGPAVPERPGGNTPDEGPDDVPALQAPALKKLREGVVRHGRADPGLGQNPPVPGFRGQKTRPPRSGCGDPPHGWGVDEAFVLTLNDSGEEDDGASPTLRHGRDDVAHRRCKRGKK